MTAAHHDGRVLLVDDEPFVLKLLTRQFANLGYTSVTSFEGAKQALQVLEQAPQDIMLICCDLQMPEMDGIEFVRHLARLAYRGGLVFVSGEDKRIQGTTVQLGRHHGLNVIGAIQKPVTLDKLTAVLAMLKPLPEQPPAPAPPARPGAPVFSAAELAQAIQNGELVNHYQPKVDMASGRLCGVEALVRWQHPQHGLVPPDDFITLAEQSGQIWALTQAVLCGPHGAMQQCRLWRDAGVHLQLAVNLSMDSLRDLDLPEVIAQAAQRTGFPMSSLVLEVTESGLMHDPVATLDILTRLRLKRIGLSIDDFGTGYSSLSQLRAIPFDELKIDRSFAHGAQADASANAIVEASLTLARELGLRTVAEGVEDDADWRHLQAAGCIQAQGYFIGRPMAAERLPQWAVDWGRRAPGLALPPVAKR